MTVHRRVSRLACRRTHGLMPTGLLRTSLDGQQWTIRGSSLKSCTLRDSEGSMESLSSQTTQSSSTSSDHLAGHRQPERQWPDCALVGRVSSKSPSGMRRGRIWNDDLEMLYDMDRLTPTALNVLRLLRTWWRSSASGNLHFVLENGSSVLSIFECHVKQHWRERGFALLWDTKGPMTSSAWRLSSGNRESRTSSRSTEEIPEEWIRCLNLSA